jgi:hypothetical protein
MQVMKNAGNGNASKDIEIVMQVTENSGIGKCKKILNLTLTLTLTLKTDLKWSTNCQKNCHKLSNNGHKNTKEWSSEMIIKYS